MKLEKALQEIFDQREKILKAFIAEYRFFPGSAVQVVETSEDGKTIRWHVEQKREEYMLLELETAFLKAVRFIPRRLLTHGMQRFLHYYQTGAEIERPLLIKRWLDELKNFQGED